MHAVLRGDEPRASPSSSAPPREPMRAFWSEPTENGARVIDLASYRAAPTSRATVSRGPCPLISLSPFLPTR